MSSLLFRKPTSCDDRIYGPDWRHWRDPEIPDRIEPVSWLLDRHRGASVANKVALQCGEDRLTYAELPDRIDRYAAVLASAHDLAQDRSPSVARRRRQEDVTAHAA
ncbi:MAG TPA: hypothetical protein VG308_07675 [Stellaceae bacterium]|jgi:hypothetical protein|nr:hypothetical protein [Stellaceae bacterium]